MDLCIILHCILCQAILLLAPLIYNYQELTVLQQRFFSFLSSLASLSPFLFWISFLCGADLGDVSTQQHEADRAVVACNGGLHPEGTAPQR